MIGSTYCKAEEGSLAARDHPSDQRYFCSYGITLAGYDAQRSELQTRRVAYISDFPHHPDAFDDAAFPSLDGTACELLSRSIIVTTMQLLFSQITPEFQNLGFASSWPFHSIP
jgi:hypothetical protein